MAFIKYLPLLLALPAKAQLFGQASKQQQYYLQQIAAYNMLHAELKQGYGVIKNGLGGIRDINTAELNAHTAYYTSLKTPSAAIKNNGQVKDILNYQSYINSLFSHITDQSDYVQNLKAKVLTDCSHDLSDLQNLLSNQLQMSDDERLKQLNTIHASMLDKYEFTQNFSNQLKTLALQRQRETNDAQTLNGLYENH
ncbi:hypothetical protein [Mucilaginibacter sp. PPCGB 2223]|uniref:hypothetical protein n=1 Tax=Mucilaginibacter sp. PPCGB 2223 TaxID=1886027 RepID=UPI00111255E4|nr:hypothetical protein [Mucilaginibacter sp. PPCGB 2223]